MFLVRNKLYVLFLSSQTPHASLSIFLRLSTLTAQKAALKPPFMSEYLISSCGFPSEEAIKLSKHLTHITSPSKPDSVLHFLRQRGFGHADIISCISKFPRLLCSDVEKTLKPKFRAWEEMGFSDPELVQLFSDTPDTLRRCDVQPRIELLRSLSLSNEKILETLKKDKYILSASFDKRIMPNITFLRECGIPDSRIGKMLVKMQWFIGRSPESIRALVRRAEELGASQGSGTFWVAIQTVSMIGRPKLNAKFKLLKSLGWSDEDITAVFRNHPTLLRLSEKNIRDKVKFFMRVGECDPSLLARSALLLYSLERRVVPRNTVLKVLEKKGLLGKQIGLASVMTMSDEKFAEKYVIPHVEKVPGIHEAYVGASSDQTWRWRLLKTAPGSLDQSFSAQ